MSSDNLFEVIYNNHIKRQSQFIEKNSIVDSDGPFQPTTSLPKNIQKIFNDSFDKNNQLKKFIPDKPVSIGVIGMKGGTGKSAVSYALTYFLAINYPDRNVLLVDVDFNNVSSTGAFTGFGHKFSINFDDILIANCYPNPKFSIDDGITQVYKNIYLLGARRSDGKRQRLIEDYREDGELLYELMDESEFIKTNPIIIYDTGSDPFFTKLTIQAADYCLVVTNTESENFDGLFSTYENIINLRGNLMGILFNTFDGNNKTVIDRSKTLVHNTQTRYFKHPYFFTPLPDSKGIKNMKDMGVSPLNIFPFFIEFNYWFKDHK